ncbi:hypothetical protein SAMN05444000_102195 [Shimia gijangensis]|uniref:Uncharacterized protein n=1 Tax=Shimia gijangensis TaxID=1470563 RepID=A0A1M6D0G8_9RHOB|nr:hypothetical protein [Shimia gijangensis]SHI66611.1 hypothetical protein SAMN05444000_102195 [Shimia gijangensis]
MKLIIHAAAGTIALLTISSFWTSTILSEIFGTHETIAAVKTAVLWGMLILIPAMATAGATGNTLGKGWRLPEVARKTKRMKIIAANGILILLPSAIFLALRAQAGHFDVIFYSLQGLELIAGATNITLLSLNMKDGIAFRARRRKRG